MSNLVLVIQKIDFWVLGDGYPPSYHAKTLSHAMSNAMLPWSNDVMDEKLKTKKKILFLFCYAIVMCLGRYFPRTV